MNKSSSIEDEYARFATIYDHIVGPFLRPIHLSMVAAMSHYGCHKVLDLCCGTGLLAGAAIEIGLKPVGIDLSPSMLRVARAKHPQGTFIDGDATNLFFPDADFHATAISFALHEKPLESAFSILSEAIRVTRPGGLVLVADYRHPTPHRSPVTGWVINLVERLAGKNHHSHFRQYMDSGGTEAMLAETDLPASPHTTHMHGWVGLYIIEKI